MKRTKSNRSSFFAETEELRSFIYDKGLVWMLVGLLSSILSAYAGGLLSGFLGR